MEIGASVSIENVHVRYGDQFILNGVSIGVPPGSSTALLGLSGCGKSTILKTIMGLVRPDRGSVKINGELISSKNAIQMRRQIGYCVQDGGLFPHLSALENITLMAKLLKWSHNKIRDRVDELFHLTQLPIEILKKFPSELSGGQRQRVGLIRSLFLDPNLVLLDEPMGALDPIVRFELQQDLKRIFGGLKKTVLIVTHDLAEAAFFTESAVLLRDGKVLQRGSIKDFILNPLNSFVSKFVGMHRSKLLDLS